MTATLVLSQLHPATDQFVRDEVELGERVALFLDDENECWGAEGMYRWLANEWEGL